MQITVFYPFKINKRFYSGTNMFELKNFAYYSNYTVEFEQWDQHDWWNALQIQQTV